MGIRPIGTAVRHISLLLVCAALPAGDLDQLLQLARDKRFFELRRALEEPGWSASQTLLYRGIVAARFGREEEGIGLLRQFLATHPAPELARQAQQEISSAFVRLGRYREAIGSSPDVDPLITSFRDFKPETVEFAASPPVKATRNRLGTWNVPVQVNGVQSQWIFDTGANFSGVCESEAKRMGLSIRNSPGTLSGVNGDNSPVRVASADVWMGGAHIRNAVVLVLANRAMYLAPIRVQMLGFLGLPEIRALRRVGISRDGEVRIRAPESASGGAKQEPNLFFDNQYPIVELSHQERRLQLVVDTGAFTSEFYPSFRAALSPGEISTMKRVRQKEAGLGGTIVKRSIEQLPELWVGGLGRPLNIEKANFAPVTDSNKRYWDGWMGINAMASGFLFDFQAMRFTVE